MVTRTFEDLTFPMFGFGLMRLPNKEDGELDWEKSIELVRYGYNKGIRYFDTAWPYLGGNSEKIAGEALSAFPRESYLLATKFPGHRVPAGTSPAEIFEQQLEKCKTEYFDFYLLHNVSETSMSIYDNQEILDYFLEQKRLGRIRHFGFSCHARKENLEAFLDRHPGVFEFCQIQLNYLDWTLQDAKGKYELLTERGLGVWVMEPVRGGKLQNLSDTLGAKLKALRPNDSYSAWAFRFIKALPNVRIVLSGMNEFWHVDENVATFTDDELLTEEETKALLDVAEALKDSVPCTACRYCCDGCPMGLNIPLLISMYNELKLGGGAAIGNQIRALPEDQLPSNCIGCGQCTNACPQNIDVPSVMSDFAERISAMG
ncbi:MAG: aldo/keto reductase [Oscillospiraceae bacterium]|nr:aldo/keto reductase [Oscillospiraceae bacterium]